VETSFPTLIELVRTRNDPDRSSLGILPSRYRR